MTSGLVGEMWGVGWYWDTLTGFLSSAYIGSLFFTGLLFDYRKKFSENYRLSSFVLAMGDFDVAMFYTGNTDGFFDGF